MQEQFAPFLSASVEYMLGEGLEKLVEHVKRVVAGATVDWSVQSKLSVSVDELEELFTDIREGTEADEASADGDGRFPALLDFVRWPAKSTEEKHQNVLQLLNETQDLIESPNFQEALMDTADASFPVLEEVVQSTVFASTSTAMVGRSGGSSPSAAYAAAAAGLQPLPFANVIPRLNKVIAKVLVADGEPGDTLSSTLKSRFPTRESTLLLCGATFLQDEPDQAAASSLLYSASQQGPRVVS